MQFKTVESYHWETEMPAFTPAVRRALNKLKSSWSIQTGFWLVPQYHGADLELPTILFDTNATVENSCLNRVFCVIIDFPE
jgi:hypothetical protein